MQAGYALTEQLYENANSLVYRAQRQADQFPVVLKVLKEEYPSPAELIRYRQEYEITHSLEVPGVVRVYSQQPYQNTLVMEVEDFGGRSPGRAYPDCCRHQGAVAARGRVDR